MSIVVTILIWFVILFVLFYLWLKRRFSYWEKNGVFSPPAKFPFGHLKLERNNGGVHFMNMYKQYKQHPMVGLLIVTKKILIVNDLDIIKNILTKDFIHFHGHGTLPKTDPLDQNLFNLEGEEWKRLRVKLTPTFTSSKMKYMFETMLTCADEMVDYLKEEEKISSIFDIKDVFAKLGTNVIGSCAFGIDTNCFKDPDSEFRKIGKRLSKPTLWEMIYINLSMIFPGLIEFFNLSRNGRDVLNFFRRTVEDTIEYREKNNIKRNDFLQLLIDMKNEDKSTGNQLTLMEIIAQVFVFFVAGFETSSITGTYAMVELARNPALRESTTTQIEEALRENNDEITYELLKMTFLDHIIQETLRLYPPLALLFRTCSKDYKVPGTTTLIDKGTFVVMPIMGIQRDPDVYRDPDHFDPDRFKPENVQGKHFSTYLPFGEGPRICIGNRFGMMQLKLALLVILRNFDVELSENIKFPLEFDAKSFMLNTKGEMLLKIKTKSQ